MAQTTANVSAAKPPVGGSIYVADTSVTLPTNASSELGTGWTALGYISEDGLTNSNTPNTSEVKAWGGDSVLTLYETRDDTFKFTLLEVLNVDVVKAVYGAENVSGSISEGISIKANNNALADKAYVFDMIMRDGNLKRIVIPSAALTDLGDITYSDSDAVGYEVTLSAHSDTSGNTHYEYIQQAGQANG